MTKHSFPLAAPPRDADVEELTAWAEAALLDGHDARAINMIIRQVIADTKVIEGEKK